MVETKQNLRSDEILYPVPAKTLSGAHSQHAWSLTVGVAYSRETCRAFYDAAKAREVGFSLRAADVPARKCGSKREPYQASTEVTGQLRISRRSVAGAGICGIIAISPPIATLLSGAADWDAA